MAKPLFARTLEDVLRSLSDRIRSLEQRRNVFGSWTIYQDTTTGDLMASFYRGQGVAPTVVTLAALPVEEES